MKTSKEYTIEFAGLSVGEHFYELEVKDSFFENLDYSEIKQGNILVKLQLLIQSNMMVFNFDTSGTVNLNCDRCGENFDFPIEGHNKLIVKVGGNIEESDDDDIIGISENEHKINLTQYLYEYITLSIPIKRVHTKESLCNKEQLKKLSEKSIREAKEQKNAVDPRWESLKNIKLN